MQTKLIALEVSLLKPDALESGADALMRADELRSHIETQLTQHGSPLRWAITLVKDADKTAHVEAVVTVP